MSRPHKKFDKLRQWNRRRNYYFKSLRMRIAKLIWDYKFKRPFEEDTIKKVLLLRDDGKIGDMVVSTSLLREFNSRGYTIDVLATSENAVIIKHNPYIRSLFIDNTEDCIIQLSRENYDLVIDMSDKMSPGKLQFLRRVNSKNVIGFNKENYNIYNKSIAYHGYNEHISKRYERLMQELNFKGFSAKYELHILDDAHKKILSFLSSLSGTHNVVINPFAADKSRDFDEAQLQELINRLNEKYNTINIILIGLPKRIAKIDINGAIKNPYMTFQATMSLIQHCDIVISPDTSVVHIAATWNKPLVALYGNDIHGQFNNNDVWGPGYNNAIQITSIDKYHSVATITVAEIIKAVDHLCFKKGSQVD